MRPDPGRDPGPEVAVDGAARREVPRQHPPLAARSAADRRPRSPPAAGRSTAAARPAAPPGAAARSAPIPDPSRRLHSSRSGAHSRRGWPPSTPSDPPSSLARNNGESGRRRSLNLPQPLLGQALSGAPPLPALPRLHLGLPNRTPRLLATLSASLVRLEIASRSCCATSAMIPTVRYLPPAGSHRREPHGAAPSESRKAGIPTAVELRGTASRSFDRARHGGQPPQRHGEARMAVALLSCRCIFGSEPERCTEPTHLATRSGLTPPDTRRARTAG